MNNKEIAELRRRFRPDRHNITQICGCYVSQQHEIISEFRQSLGLMPADEAEKYLALFKKALSGRQNRNLLDLSFETQQVAGSEEHRLLTALRDTALKDDEVLRRFYEKVIPTVSFDDNFLILLSHDVYDVPFHAGDGATLEDDGNTYAYVVCCVCPVKLGKPSLRYVADESLFHNRGADFTVSAPEFGFLFPAFDDRRTNLYNALYYTRNLKESYPGFVDAVFHVAAPMPAAVQKDSFCSLLQDSLKEECSFSLVEAVQDELRDRMEAHKAARDAEPLTIYREDIDAVLDAHSVSEPRRAAFHVQFDSVFGTYAAVSPQNLIDAGQMEIKTPDVTIKVSPDRRDLVETRQIGGSSYILIRAEGTIEVNGVSIQPDPTETPVS